MTTAPNAKGQQTSYPESNVSYFINTASLVTVLHLSPMRRKCTSKSYVVYIRQTVTLRMRWCNLNYYQSRQAKDAPKVIGGRHSSRYQVSHTAAPVLRYDRLLGAGLCPFILCRSTSSIVPVCNGRVNFQSYRFRGLWKCIRQRFAPVPATTGAYASFVYRKPHGPI